jgi:DNA mismatch endonuclease (patch repair protein)
MTDVLTPEQRSFNMSQVKSRNTGLELRLKKLLRASGMKNYRVTYKLFGNPDIVFTKNKIALFIDGCFWHKCKLHFHPPETRRDFWLKKIEGNVKRDRLVNKELRRINWRVVRFWQHEIEENPESVLGIIEEAYLAPLIK